MGSSEVRLGQAWGGRMCIGCWVGAGEEEEEEEEARKKKLGRTLNCSPLSLVSAECGGGGDDDVDVVAAQHSRPIAKPEKDKTTQRNVYGCREVDVDQKRGVEAQLTNIRVSVLAAKPVA